MCNFQKHLSERNIKVLKVLLTVFNLAVLFSNIGCIIYFSAQMYHDSSSSYIIEYKRETCIPVFSEVISIPCESSWDKWIPIWKDQKNRTMVISPFSSKTVRLSAIVEMGEIALMSEQPCMCRSNSVSIKIPSDCQLWDVCIFNTMFVEYLQRDYYLHYRTSISFIVSSGVSAVLSIITLPLSIRLYKESGSTYIELK